MYQQVQQHRFCSTKEMLYITTVLETPKLHAHLVLRRDLLFGQVSNSTDCFLEEVYSQFWISLHSIGHYYQLSHPQNRSAGLNCCPSCNVERPKVNPIGECPSPPVPNWFSKQEGTSLSLCASLSRRCAAGTLLLVWSFFFRALRQE